MAPAIAPPIRYQLIAGAGDGTGAGVGGVGAGGTGAGAGSGSGAGAGGGALTSAGAVLARTAKTVKWST